MTPIPNHRPAVAPERRSRFHDDVDPDAPHPEYPRPQLRRAEWTTLNGWWELAIVAADDPAPADYPHRVLVPFPVGSALSGVERGVAPDERLWMRRGFRFAADALGERRLRLHFGAVDWDCTVVCDGVEVGRHRGGHTPFHVDLTDALADADDHEIVLSILDPTDAGPQPVGKQVLEPLAIWYPAVTGVWQTVWLEPVPATCVESVVATTDLAAQRVSVRVGVSGAVPGDAVRVELAGTTADGDVVDGQAVCNIEVPDLRPWLPDDPHLYDLRVTVADDAIESYFGAREVGIERDGQGVLRLTLNGAVCFHLGLLDQGWWPDGLYTAPTDEALAFDIEATKAMGFNTIRKHVKVEPARWYWHADRLGMLVWQDMPSTAVDRPEMLRQMGEGIDHPDMDWSTVGPARDPEGFRRELDEMLDALAPFSCIAVWVPFNEGWGQHDTAATLDHVAERDPHRLVDGPSGWVDGGEGHLRDHHMYFKEETFPGPDASRAVVYGEFGGYTLAVDDHRLEAPTFGYGEAASAEELAARYSALMATLAALVPQGLAGAIYTQTTDVEGEINGLLTYDRAVQKVPSATLRALHRPLTDR